MNVLFLAAGLGTRLRPLTLKYPKPCVPFLNVPMGYYNFRFTQYLDISNLVVNTHYLPNKIKDLYQNQNFYTADIKFSDESNRILGSAGGLKKASSYFNKSSTDDSILMLNSDEVLFDVDPYFLTKAHESHLKENNLATLVVMKHPEAGKKFGAIWYENNCVVNIGKSTLETHPHATPFHYIGMMFIKSTVLDFIKPDVESNIFYDVLINLLSSHKVSVFEITCRWYETGNPQDLFSATKDALTKIDSTTHDFINQYDDSNIIKNQNGCSLVSKKFNISPNQLNQFNVISKTTNPNLISGLDLFENTICFDNEIINLNYFKS